MEFWKYVDEVEKILNLIKTFKKFYEVNKKLFEEFLKKFGEIGKSDKIVKIFDEIKKILPIFSNFTKFWKHFEEVLKIIWQNFKKILLNN